MWNGGLRGPRYTRATMPIYQYDCGKCEQRVEIFHRPTSRSVRPRGRYTRSRSARSADFAAEHAECGSTRVMSLFARAKSESDRLGDVDFEAHESALEAGDERSFAQWARRAGAEYDEALGTNYRELAEKAEAGEGKIDSIDAGHTFRHKVVEKQAKNERSKKST